jgi:hypothetical protein
MRLAPKGAGLLRFRLSTSPFLAVGVGLFAVGDCAFIIFTFVKQKTLAVMPFRKSA